MIRWTFRIAGLLIWAWMAWQVLTWEYEIACQPTMTGAGMAWMLVYFDLPLYCGLLWGILKFTSKEAKEELWEVLFKRKF